MAKMTRELLQQKNDYKGIFTEMSVNSITASAILKAYDESDSIAIQVVQECIMLWGMAVANLVSLFNPEKIILGGGVFGPGIKLIPLIYEEATKWAQPLSMKKVVIEPSGLAGRAGLYGAALRALQIDKA
jgi:glucokinase